MKDLFVKTTDEDTAKKLRSAGLKCLGFESGVWTFLNDQTFKFDTEDKKNITYSNILTM